MMDQRATHNHDDDTPTIGCPACIAIVRSDQERARWADAPRRRTHWLYTANGVWRTPVGFTVVLPVPAGSIADDVTEYYAATPRVVAATLSIDSSDALNPVWWCTRIGGIVPDVATPAPAEAPTLFDGAA